jgi:hypothetical protein
MSLNERNAGTVNVLMERLSKERLPRLLEIREYVFEGKALNDFDIDYLEQVLKDANENRHLLIDFPEYHDIAVRLVNLYNEITTKALENEKNQNP